MWPAKQTPLYSSFFKKIIACLDKYNIIQYMVLYNLIVCLIPLVQPISLSLSITKEWSLGFAQQVTYNLAGFAKAQNYSTNTIVALLKNQCYVSNRSEHLLSICLHLVITILCDQFNFSLLILPLFAVKHRKNYPVIISSLHNKYSGNSIHLFHFSKWLCNLFTLCTNHFLLLLALPELLA